jgi:4-hydroxy-tetrahydrodipicolinate reductase
MLPVCRYIPCHEWVVMSRQELQMKAKLVVVGAGGRMGRRIIALAAESGRFDIVGAVENESHPEIGKDAGLVAGIERLDAPLGSSWPAEAEIAIDFSLPQAADRTLQQCTAHGTALVLGTTGLTAGQQEAIKAAAEKVPVLYGTNMSVGMNILFSIVGKIAAMLGEDYDIEIVEEHHRFKKDAPSGSALTLAQNICKATNRPYPGSLIDGRSGKEALRKKGEIGMHAVRAGDITGVHSVIYGTLGETVTLNHTAHSRDTLVRGALRAAEWLLNKPPALYSMADVLGIK